MIDKKQVLMDMLKHLIGGEEKTEEPQSVEDMMSKEESEPEVEEQEDNEENACTCPKCGCKLEDPEAGCQDEECPPDMPDMMASKMKGHSDIKAGYLPMNKKPIIAVSISEVIKEASPKKKPVSDVLTKYSNKGK